MRRHDHAGRPRSLGSAADGAEVVRIGDPVEADEERTRLSRELEGIRVPVWLAKSQHALVVASPGLLGQVPIGLGLGPDPRTWLLEPWLGGQGTLGHPELAHLAWAAKSLAHGPPAVDLLRGRGHFFGTSW